MDERSDEQLYDAWRSGRPEAARQLYRRNFASVFRFFRSKLDDADEVADLAHETFLEFYRSRTPGPLNSVRAFLLGIARHVLFAHLRRRYRREQIELAAESIGRLTQHNPSSILASKRRARHLLEALRTLRLEDQMLIELKYFEALAIDDVARALHLQKTAIPGRLRRAKQGLRDEIERRLGPADDRDDTFRAWIDEIRALLERTGDEPSPA